MLRPRGITLALMACFACVSRQDSSKWRPPKEVFDMTIPLNVTWR